MRDVMNRQTPAPRSSYLHALDGRLRIKVALIKRAPAKALELERRLRQVDGTTQVRANPTTGNVLICYHPSRLTLHALLTALDAFGYLQRCGPPDTLMGGVSASPLTVGDRLADTLVRSAVELALHALMHALL